MQSNLYSFKIELTEYYNPQLFNDQNFYFVFSEIDKLTKQFQSFEIEPIKEESSIINISLKANNVKKSIDFLNKLTEVYLRRSLDQKNRVAENTIMFIDNQLKEISDSLNRAEQNLQDFRSSKQIMNLDLQAAQVFEQLKDYENEKARLDIKALYYKTLQQYIFQNKDLEIGTMFCQQSIQISPEDGLFRHRLGRLYLKQNRLDEALKEFKTAIALGYDSSEYVEQAQNRLTAKAK